MSTFGSDDVERFRALIERRLGLVFDDSKAGFLAEVLQRRLDATRFGHVEYLARLDVAATAPERRALATELTVGETYFFRNAEQFRAFSEIVIPARTRAPHGGGLRILSAGCASGEEPYTLAIILEETLGASWPGSIVAVDMNPLALEKAARARFSAWALRATPAEVKERWFRRQGSELVLDERARSRVTFVEANLAEGAPDLWKPESFDVVFCRNMMMYFGPEAARALLARITRAIAPGGYLFLGHAETLRGLSQSFHLHHTHGTFYYQRARTDDASVPPPSFEAERTCDVLSSLPVPPSSSDTWADDIRRATERILALTEPAHADDAPSARRHVAANLEPALELLRSERFADALALLDALPPESAEGRDVLLLRASLQMHAGDLVAAEVTCRRLLEVNQLDAGAHYILALCRADVQDLRSAIEHDRTAAYLDPGFAMPRLHLGLLARRAGECEDARRELGHALALLELEDPSRLLLFGGGFGRASLLSLCTAEIAACGERQ